MSELLTRWSVNERLLQSYRSIFISSQSFLLAVGAFLLNSKELPGLIFIPIAAIALLIIWYCWHRIVVTRALYVDYYKFQLKDEWKSFFDNCTEKDYVKNKDKRMQINKNIKEKNWRLTRKKMDLLLPIVYSFLWGILLLYSIILLFC